MDTHKQEATQFQCNSQLTRPNSYAVHSLESHPRK